MGKKIKHCELNYDVLVTRSESNRPIYKWKYIYINFIQKVD